MSQLTLDKPDKLEYLADHCIEAKGLINEIGTETMKVLIDLLLFEVGKNILRNSGPHHSPRDEGRS